MKLHRRHIRGQVDVDSSPEGGRKAAPKHDVRRSFLRAIADLTSNVMHHAVAELAFQSWVFPSQTKKTSPKLYKIVYR